MHETTSPSGGKDVPLTSSALPSTVGPIHHHSTPTVTGCSHVNRPVEGTQQNSGNTTNLNRLLDRLTMSWLSLIVAVTVCVVQCVLTSQVYAAITTDGAPLPDDKQRASVASVLCDADGLAESPRVCRRGEKLMPNVYGGPATLNQCSFGSSTPGNSPEWGGASCWSGSLFGFSGIDGQTSVESQFVGWFVNGSYSVHLWLPTKRRQLTLGFTSAPGAADAASDTVFIALNDALYVERGNDNSTGIAVTWADWRTIVGEIKGDAMVALEEENKAGTCEYEGGCCGAVVRVALPPSSPVSGIAWNITKTYSGHGSTICYIELEIAGQYTFMQCSLANFFICYTELEVTVQIRLPSATPGTASSPHIHSVQLNLRSEISQTTCRRVPLSNVPGVEGTKNKAKRFLRN